MGEWGVSTYLETILSKMVIIFVVSGRKNTFWIKHNSVTFLIVHRENATPPSVKQKTMGLNSQKMLEKIARSL